MRQLFAWLSFTAFVLGGIMAGPLLAFRLLAQLVPGLGGSFPPLSIETLVVTAVAFSSIAIGVYLSALLWMALASLVFTRAEVRQIVFYGPTFPPERWLFQRLFPLHGRRSRRRR